MSRAPTRQTSSPQWRAMKRLSASDGACPNSTFITGTGATNTTRTPVVARPVINRINSMWAASMVVLPQQQKMNGRARRVGAPALDSPLPAPVALDHLLDPTLCTRRHDHLAVFLIQGVAWRLDWLQSK